MAATLHWPNHGGPLGRRPLETQQCLSPSSVGEVEEGLLTAKGAVPSLC